MFKVTIIFVLLLATIIATGCAPESTNNFTTIDCVVYSKSKIKCKHGNCVPLPSPTPEPTVEATPEPISEDNLEDECLIAE